MELNNIILLVLLYCLIIYVLVQFHLSDNIQAFSIAILQQQLFLVILFYLVPTIDEMYNSFQVHLSCFTCLVCDSLTWHIL